MLKRIYTLLLFIFVGVGMSVHAQEFSFPSADINCQLFPSNHIYNTRLDTLLAAGQIRVDPRSDVWLDNMDRSRNLFPDFAETVWPPASDAIIGIPYTTVTASQPFTAIDYYLYGDESDPGPMPIPPDAPREGGPTTSSGDRHVLVVEDENCILYELWYAFKNPDDSWSAGSGAVYDLMSNWLRPDGWTSADAAGLPILPFLPKYQDIIAGEMNHAIRFTLSQTAESYVWPARHAAGSRSIDTHPPLGQIFLLRSDFDTSGLSPAGQIMAEAMKRYGIILADNGSNGYVSGTHDPRWRVEEIKDDFQQITFNDFVAVDICTLRVNPDSGEAAVGANPGGTGCVRDEGFSVSGGYAQGRVVDPTGNPLAGVTVSAGTFGTATTDATGTYYIDSIPFGSDFILSADATDLGLGTQYWQNSTMPEGATTFNLSSSMPSAINRNFVFSAVAGYDLNIHKDASASTFLVGEDDTYTLTVRNFGSSQTPNDADIIVTDVVPVELEVQSVDGTNWDCSATTGQNVSCIYTALPLNGNSTAAPITITVRPTSDAVDTSPLTNMATVDIAGDSNPINNSDDILTYIIDELPTLFDPPFGLKFVDASGAAALQWGMWWSNPSSITAFNVRVVDPIPTGTTFIDDTLSCIANGSSTVSRCEYDSGNNQVIYEGSIAPNPSAFTRDAATNAIDITFQTTLGDDVTEVTNIASANWDRNGNGTIDDDMPSQLAQTTSATFSSEDHTEGSHENNGTILQPEDLGIVALPTTGEIPLYDNSLLFRVAQHLIQTISMIGP